MLQDKDRSAGASTPDTGNKKPKRNPFLRVVKWTAGIIVGLLLCVVILISIAVWLLTPEKLTPLIEKYGSEYIIGEIKAKKVELTFWNSFPRINIKAEGLEIISHALDSLSQAERAELPVNADTLLRIESFSGGINLPLALKGKISLYDIEVNGGEANIVQYSPSVANYNIVPPSEKNEESDILPDISINHFLLRGETPIRFFSLPDSTDVTVHIRQTSISDSSPFYTLNIDGDGTADLDNRRWFENLHFGIDGKVEWSPKSVDIIGLQDLKVNVGNISAMLNARLDFTDVMTLKEFRMKASSLKVADLISLIPSDMGEEIHKIETDMELDLDVELDGPFRPKMDEWPTADISISIPKGVFKYDRINLNSVKGVITARLEGNDPDNSWVNVDNLTLIGRAMAMTLNGKVTNVISDPLINMNLRGGADFSRLPSSLLQRLPFVFSGRMHADAGFNLRQSFLNERNFHRIKATGSMLLNNFHLTMRDSTFDISADKANLNFGTSSTHTLPNDRVADSLLTARLSIDTVNVYSEGMSLSGKKINAGIGMKNTGNLGDTTQINPLGFSIKGDLLKILSPADSMTIRMRTASVRGMLTRYEGDNRRPLLRFTLNAGRMFYRDSFNRANVRNGEVSFTAHTKARPTMSRRVGEAYDSLVTVYPHLHRDSILSLARAEARKKRSRNNIQSTDSTAVNNRRRDGRSGREHDIDLLADKSVRSLLQWWEASGSLKAERGGFFTPYFPLRNRIKHLEIEFNTDSVVLKNTGYRLGQSDFLINGTITNISRAVSSRRGSPLRLDFEITSDTLNINEVAKAAFAGSAFSDKVAKGAEIHIKDTENEDELQKSIEENADLNDKLAFIVPSNIEASLTLKAANVLYADIWAQRLSGKISVANGRINLQRFAGFTDLGSLDLTALYTAPDLEDLGFAGGMVIRNLDLKRFLHMLPEIDSIMPLLRDVEGIITADIAMTTELDSLMDLKFHTLNLAMKLHGDSLVLLDSKTFRTAAKWLLFKKKDRNMIDSMSVEMAIHDSRLDLYPFVFDIDRYRLGVSGGNTFNGEYDYHVAVLKSPVPFKFGINIKGEKDKFKIRLGRARFNENAVSSSRQLTDTLRINLLREIESVFRFGVDNGQHRKLILNQPKITKQEFEEGDNFTRADSLLMIKEGVIEAPPGYLEEIEAEKAAAETAEKKKHKSFLGIF